MRVVHKLFASPSSRNALYRESTIRRDKVAGEAQGGIRDSDPLPVILKCTPENLEQAERVWPGSDSR